jgi:uncharacterized protein with von Willebrand factor type A (vWA) domain
VAETLDWAGALTELDQIALDPATVSDTLGVLLKYQDDIARMEGSRSKALLDEARAEARGGRVAVDTTEAGESRGRIADNIVHFARALRRAGVPVGPAAVIDAIRAVEVAGHRLARRFYWALHSVFVAKREHRSVFHEAFELFWRERGLLDKMLAMLSPVAPPRPGEKEKPRAGEARAREALGADERREDKHPETEIDARLTVSSREVLQRRDLRR